MDLVLLKIFPAILIAGGVALLFWETKSFLKERDQVVKLIRRLTGAVVLIVMAGMVFSGELPAPDEKDPTKTMELFRYWLIILGLAALLGTLAIWDALSGVRQLKNFVAQVEIEEMAHLREHLQQRNAHENGAVDKPKKKKKKKKK